MEQDLELVKRCLSGEDSAWEALLRAHTSKVYNLCYRFTSSGAQAEDLTQEVFIKIYQTLRSFDASQGTFTTWLNRITRNHLVDHYRRTKKDRVTDSIEDKVERAEEKPSGARDPMGQLESREVRELLQAGLAMLSPEMREAVILRDLQELDYQEIAEVLGVPEGTVKSRINRGRLELAKIIKRMKGMKG